MTSHLRYARALTTTAGATAAGAYACAWHSLWVPAGVSVCVAVFLAECGHREYSAHERIRREHEWARRRAQGHQPPPLDPCCLLYEHSHGAVHDDHRCTRDRTAEQFDEIVAQFEQPDTDTPDDPRSNAA